MIIFSMTTSSTIELGGFNISVTVPNTSGITFTGGDSSAANYIFEFNSLGLLFGNPIDSSSGDIGDLTMTFNQQLIPGTYDLGRMFFDVAPNAPLAIVNVTLDAATSFTSGLAPFDPYDYTPTGGSTIGTITVNVGDATVVPEPSSLIILIGVAGWSLLYHRHRVTLFKLGLHKKFSDSLSRSPPVLPSRSLF